jgi:hypothetical protein
MNRITYIFWDLVLKAGWAKRHFRRAKRLEHGMNTNNNCTEPFYADILECSTFLYQEFAYQTELILTFLDKMKRNKLCMDEKR